MSALLLALALMVQDAAPAAESAPAPAAQNELPYPPGAPREDYQLVAWCYGALGGYLDLHDQVMPEVTRIESTFRRPGSKLSDDLKVYADMQAEGKRDMRLFTRAMTAAEKASMRPINAAGAAAIKRGRTVWLAPAGVTKARMAQEWMSWSLPARCIPTAQALEKRAILAGAALQVNLESTTPDPAPAPPPADAAPTPDPAPTPAGPTVDDLLAAPPPPQGSAGNP